MLPRSTHISASNCVDNEGVFYNSLGCSKSPAIKTRNLLTQLVAMSRPSACLVCHKFRSPWTSWRPSLLVPNVDVIRAGLGPAVDARIGWASSLWLHVSSRGEKGRFPRHRPVYRRRARTDSCSSAPGARFPEEMKDTSRLHPFFPASSSTKCKQHGGRPDL